MTSRFQEELKRGLDRRGAIRIAASSSDASIVISALVLFCATLGVSFVSSINLIGAICVMPARGALVSALVSIFLMPAVLYVCELMFNKTCYHWKTPDPAPTLETEALLKGEREALPESGTEPLSVPETERTEAPSPESEETERKKRARKGKKEKTPAGVK